MAINLAKLGWFVHGHDLYKPLVEKLVKAGGHAAASPSEAAKMVDFLVLMVINSTQVDEVCRHCGETAGNHCQGVSQTLAWLHPSCKIATK